MHQSIQLIINADDLGAGEPTDRGIIEAFTDGVVTSASLLANGPSFDSAAAMAINAGLPVGVHLNLSEGFPLSGPIKGLTNANGRFPGKEISRQRFLEANIDAAHLQDELVAQITKIETAGLRPDHIDTHQHSGLFPVITAALISAARISGINRTRLAKPVRPSFEDPPSISDEMRLYRQLAPRMAEQLKLSGMVTPNGLFGMPLLNRLDEKHLAKLLSEISAGIWELMVHPGYFDPQSEFSGPERAIELAALTSSGIRNILQQHDIKLISFAELTCAY